MALPKHKPLVAAVVCATVLSTSGCTMMRENAQLVIGCATGTVVGIAAGAIAGQGDPRYIAGGAVVGLVAGCGAGYYLQQREEQLAENAEKHGFKSEFVRISEKDGVAATFSKEGDSDVVASQMTVSSDKPIFATGQYRITDKTQLANLDSFIKGYISGIDNRSKIYIVGHTDAVGDPRYNQRLSEKRAEFIARRFLSLGAPKDIIFYEGVGESQPIASNDTNAGRAQNRRFELIDIFNDSISTKAVSLEKVLEVSRAKKQRLTNVMNDEGRLLVKQQMNHKEEPKEETNKPVKKANKTDVVQNTAPVRVKDTNPLKLEGSQFDGNRTSTQLTQNLGKYYDDSWSLFNKAHAELAFVDSCAVSEPRTKSTIKTLGASNTISNTSEFLPSMIGNIWWSKVDEAKASTMVMLGPVRVNKNTFESEGNPSLKFIKNYKFANQSVDYAYDLNAETYRGDDAVLFRVYPKGKSSIKCADFVFSTKGDLATKYSEIVYNSRGNTLSKVMTLKTRL